MAARKSSISDEVLSYVHSNLVNIKDRIIYTHAHMENPDWDLDYKEASIFIRNLDFLNSLSKNPITIKIVSPGGCYYSGFMMYDAIKKSPSPITCESYSIAASMGSIIPQAAAKRLISANASFMVHRLSYHDDGDIMKLKSGIEFAQKQMDRMYSVYAERCVNGKFFKSKKMTIGEIEAFIKDKLEKTGDWWMTPLEAVHYGFMDGVL